MDIGNPLNIHPANKQDVGHRLALWALAKTYKKNVECSGPVYTSSRKSKDKIALTFDHVGNGLVVVGGPQGNNFQIAGEDKVFKPAKIRVKGKTVEVFNEGIPHPQSVRYAFTNVAQATLFNSEGLPASSFRTDDWKP